MSRSKHPLHLALALLLSFALGLGAATFPVASSKAAVPESESESESDVDAARDVHRITFEVDWSELGKRGGGLDNKVREHLRPSFEAAGLQFVALDDDPELHLRLRLRVLESDRWDFGLHFEFVDGDQVEPAVEWVDCYLCMDARMFPRLDELSPRVIANTLERLEDDAASSDEGETGGESGDDDGGAGDDGPSDGDGNGDGGEPAPPPKTIGPLGFAGIVGLGLGAGLTIGGGVEISRGVHFSPIPEDLLRRTRVDDRTPGLVLLGIGVPVIVAGALMLGIDLARRSKARKNHPNMALLPLLGPQTNGLTFVGRF